MDNVEALLRSLADRGETEAVMAMTDDGAGVVSAGTLARRASRFANGLCEQGFGSGDRVALIADNHPDLIAAMIGVMAGGLIAVPIDVQMEDETTTKVLKDCGAKILLTSAKRVDRLVDATDVRGPAIYLLDDETSAQRDGDGDDSNSAVPSWQSLWSEDTQFKRRQAGEAQFDAEKTAVLFYTSGTTGPPKGVPLSHRNLMTQIDAVDRAGIVNSGDRVLLPLPLHHVYPLVIGLLTPLALELPVILPRSLTGPEIQRALGDGRATVLIGVPRLYRALYDAIVSQAKHALGNRTAGGVTKLIKANGWLAGQSPIAAGFLFRALRNRVGPQLRVLASGGSPLDPELGRRLEGLGWKVTVGYGLTETSPLLTILPPGDGHLQTVGRAIEAVELRIDQDWNPDSSESSRESGDTPRDDAENENEGEGEILARGASVFSGYWNSPEKTEQAFTSDGWFRTGDLGYLDHRHRLHVTGRVSTLIITEGGEKVQPDEIESAYAEADEIREIGVLLRDQRLHALVVPETSQLDREGDVQQQVREAIERVGQHLPSHQRVNEVVVTRKALPRTRIGKIRRHKLEQHFTAAEQQDDARSGPLSRDDWAAEDHGLLDAPAASETWNLLTEQFPDEPLAPDTSLRAEVGVDSMQWLNLTMEIAQRTGVELDDRKLAEVDTVRDLLQTIGQSAGDKADDDLLEEPEKLLSEHQRKRLRPLGSVGSSAAKGGLAINRHLIRWFFRLQVDGFQHLPETGPLVIAANHVSHLDPFVLCASLDPERLQRTYWAAWVGATRRNPFSRLASRLAKTIPIDAERGVMSSLAFGAAVLQRDGILVWFPEGERSETGELQPFRPGLGVLLQRHPALVVPAFVEGTYEALPRHSKRIRRRTVRVRYGRPIDPRELPTHDREQETQENAADRIVDELHRAVERLKL